MRGAEPRHAVAMRSFVYLLLAASSVALTACADRGNATATLPGETDAGAGDTSDEPDASGTSGPETDGGETGDEDTGAAVEACIEDGALARGLVIADREGEALHLYEPGAEPRTLSAALPDGVDAPATLTTDANAEYIAVASSYSIYLNPGTDDGATLRLYARGSGALVWERALPNYRLGALHVDALGRVAATVGWSATPLPAGILVIDGVVQELTDFAPAGPIGPSGWIPGYIYGPGQEQIGTGLYNHVTEQLVEITSGNNPPGWRADGETIEFIDNDSVVPRHVIAGPTSATTVELTPFAGLDAPVYTDGVAGDYRLLVANLEGPEDEGARELVRLEVSTGELTTIDPAPPPGFQPFDCYFQRNAVDVEGRVLFELRDAGAAQIFAWDPARETWSALGVGVTAVDDVQVIGGHGRVQEIHGFGVNTTYCEQAEWSAPPANAIAGSTIQLARLEPHLSLVVDAEGVGAVSVDPLERCASWTSVGDASQTLHDLDDGDVIELPTTGHVIWLE